MTLEEFIIKWNNRGVDFDGVYGDQCMDLMHQYCVEVLGLTDGRILAASGAKDVYLNFDTIFGKEHFDRIPNTPTNVPEKGDIILWGTTIGLYGHVAIYKEGDVNNFKSFDQNWPVGSKCHIQDHNYTGVLGWLRPKYRNNIPTDTGLPVITQQMIDDLRRDRDENWNKYQGALQQVEDREKTIANLNKTIDEQSQKLETKDVEVSNLKEQLLICSQTQESLQTQANKLPELQAQLDTALEDRKRALDEVERLRRSNGQMKGKSLVGASTEDVVRELFKRFAERITR